SIMIALESAQLEAPDYSLLLAARRLGVPLTVHAALGAEIIHQHPAVDGAAIGGTSMRDFRRLAESLPALEDGVVLNLGSAVIMPEVFLKALTMSRNVHDGAPRRFVAADFDMIRHYRPRVNVVERPTRSGGGVGYQLTGHHEIMVPPLAGAVLEKLVYWVSVLRVRCGENPIPTCKIARFAPVRRPGNRIIHTWQNEPESF